MARSLFFGPDAIDSIIPLVHATDAKLVKLANEKSGTLHSQYTPWMAIPQAMFKSEDKLHWTTNERFVQSDDQNSIQKIFSLINLENDLIPSHESYQLKISQLSPQDIGEFNKNIKRAETRLIEILPHFEILISSLIRKYIPIENIQASKSDTGMSALWFKGAIFFERSQSATLDQRTENLAHEIAHQIIINYQLNDTLITSDLNEGIYSGIRATNRPAILAFHAAAALSYMLWIQSTLHNQERAKQLHDQLKSTLKDLEKVHTTLIGRKLLEEFHQALHFSN